MDPEEAFALLKRLPVCVLASSTPEGRPWPTPVFYNYTHDFRFVWESEKDAHHSQLVQANEQVAFVIADLGGKDPTQSLYIEAVAREVPPSDLAEAIETFWHGPHQKRDRIPLTADDYQGENPLRLYEARPVQAYTLIQTQVESGHLVERRVAISLF